MNNPLIKIKVGDKEIKGLIDTGSNMTCIQKEWYKTEFNKNRKKLKNYRL